MTARTSPPLVVASLSAILLILLLVSSAPIAAAETAGDIPPFLPPDQGPCAPRTSSITGDIDVLECARYCLNASFYHHVCPNATCEGTMTNSIVQNTTSAAPYKRPMQPQQEDPSCHPKCTIFNNMLNCMMMDHRCVWMGDKCIDGAPLECKTKNTTACAASPYCLVTSSATSGIGCETNCSMILNSVACGKFRHECAWDESTSGCRKACVKYETYDQCNAQAACTPLLDSEDSTNAPIPYTTASPTMKLSECIPNCAQFSGSQVSCMMADGCVYGGVKKCHFRCHRFYKSNDCAQIPGCLWHGSSCKTDCAAITDLDACDGKCLWLDGKCTLGCTELDHKSCDAASHCEYVDYNCIPLCSNLTTEAQCQTTHGAWSKCAFVNGTCTTRCPDKSVHSDMCDGACYTFATRLACQEGTQSTDCGWNPSTEQCEASCSKRTGTSCTSMPFCKLIGTTSSEGFCVSNCSAAHNEHDCNPLTRCHWDFLANRCVDEAPCALKSEWWESSAQPSETECQALYGCHWDSTREHDWQKCSFDCTTIQDEGTCDSFGQCFWLYGQCHTECLTAQFSYKMPTNCTLMSQVLPIPVYECSALTREQDCHKIRECTWYNGKCDVTCFLRFTSDSCEAATNGCVWSHDIASCQPPRTCSDATTESACGDVAINNLCMWTADGKCLNRCVLGYPGCPDWSEQNDHCVSVPKHRLNHIDASANMLVQCFPGCTHYSGSKTQCEALAPNGCKYNDATKRCLLSCDVFLPPCPQGCWQNTAGFCAGFGAVFGANISDAMSLSPEDTNGPVGSTLMHTSIDTAATTILTSNDVSTASNAPDDTTNVPTTISSSPTDAPESTAPGTQAPNDDATKNNNSATDDKHDKEDDDDKGGFLGFFILVVIVGILTLIIVVAYKRYRAAQNKKMEEGPGAAATAQPHHHQQHTHSHQPPPASYGDVQYDDDIPLESTTAGAAAGGGGVKPVPPSHEMAAVSPPANNTSTGGVQQQHFNQPTNGTTGTVSEHDI